MIDWAHVRRIQDRLENYQSALAKHVFESRGDRRSDESKKLNAALTELRVVAAMQGELIDMLLDHHRRERRSFEPPRIK